MSKVLDFVIDVVAGALVAFFFIFGFAAILVGCMVAAVLIVGNTPSGAAVGFLLFLCVFAGIAFASTNVGRL